MSHCREEKGGTWAGGSFSTGSHENHISEANLESGSCPGEKVLPRRRAAFLSESDFYRPYWFPSSSALAVLCSRLVADWLILEPQNHLDLQA